MNMMHPHSVAFTSSIERNDGMATRKKSSQAKTVQKKQSKTSPSAPNSTKTTRKTSTRKSMKSPRDSKSSRVVLLDPTGQEQAKTWQQEQEIWMERVLGSAMDAIITMDEQQRVVLFNKGAESMFRCSSSQAIGKLIDQFIPQRFRAIHQAHVQQFMQSGDTIRSMGRLGSIVAQRSDGEEFPIEASISQFDFSGKKRMTVILRDITERRTIEEELEKEEKFISTILDTTAALVVVLDPEWRIVRFNRVCENLTGRTMKEMRGKPFLDLVVVSGEDTPEVKSLLALFKGGQFPKSFEKAWVDQNLQLHWIKWSNTVITSKEGKTENIIATGIDITECRQAEQEIQRLWKHKESILNSAWEGIYGVDRIGKTTFFNRSAEQLTGWTRGEVQGQFLHPLLHHTKADGAPYPWKKCPVYLSLKKGNVHSVDTEVLWHKDGTSFPVEYTSMPVHNDNKKIEGAVVTFRDITDRKKSEAALRQREVELQESQEVLQALGGQLISAQEDERRRISRELHDDMNQRLAVLAFNIQSAQNGVDVSPLMYQVLQELYDGVSSLSDDVRHLAYQLHPSILDDLGLEVALRSFVDDFSKWEGIPVTLTATDMPITLPQELASCLYRVAQEGMRNVTRHAQATQVDVRLIGVDGGVRLSIQDNGKGFTFKERRLAKQGLGLIGMEERVRVVQGTYEVKSAPGQGTKITVWVPIPKEESR
jgi:PAS domain S-box-containing protein